MLSHYFCEYYLLLLIFITDAAIKYSGYSEF